MNTTEPKQESGQTNASNSTKSPANNTTPENAPEHESSELTAQRKILNLIESSSLIKEQSKQVEQANAKVPHPPVIQKVNYGAGDTHVNNQESGVVIQRLGEEEDWSGVEKIERRLKRDPQDKSNIFNKIKWGLYDLLKLETLPSMLVPYAKKKLRKLLGMEVGDMKIELYPGTHNIGIRIPKVEGTLEKSFGKVEVLAQNISLEDLYLELRYNGINDTSEEIDIEKILGLSGSVSKLRLASILINDMNVRIPAFMDVNMDINIRGVAVEGELGIFLGMLKNITSLFQSGSIQENVLSLFKNTVKKGIEGGVALESLYVNIHENSWINPNDQLMHDYDEEEDQEISEEKMKAVEENAFKFSGKFSAVNIMAAGTGKGGQPKARASVERVMARGLSANKKKLRLGAEGFDVQDLNAVAIGSKAHATASGGSAFGVGFHDGDKSVNIKDINTGPLAANANLLDQGLSVDAELSQTDLSGISADTGKAKANIPKAILESARVEALKSRNALTANVELGTISANEANANVGDNIEANTGPINIERSAFQIVNEKSKTKNGENFRGKLSKERPAGDDTYNKGKKITVGGQLGASKVEDLNISMNGGEKTAHMDALDMSPVVVGAKLEKDIAFSNEGKNISKKLNANASIPGAQVSGLSLDSEETQAHVATLEASGISAELAQERGILEALLDVEHTRAKGVSAQNEKTGVKKVTAFDDRLTPNLNEDITHERQDMIRELDNPDLITNKDISLSKLSMGKASFSKDKNELSSKLDKTELNELHVKERRTEIENGNEKNSKDDYHLEKATVSPAAVNTNGDELKVATELEMSGMKVNNRLKIKTIDFNLDKDGNGEIFVSAAYRKGISFNPKVRIAVKNGVLDFASLKITHFGYAGLAKLLLTLRVEDKEVRYRSEGAEKFPAAKLKAVGLMKQDVFAKDLGMDNPEDAGHIFVPKKEGAKKGGLDLLGYLKYTVQDRVKELMAKSKATQVKGSFQELDMVRLNLNTESKSKTHKNEEELTTTELNITRAGKTEETRKQTETTTAKNSKTALTLDQLDVSNIHLSARIKGASKSQEGDGPSEDHDPNNLLNDKIGNVNKSAKHKTDNKSANTPKFMEQSFREVLVEEVPGFDLENNEMAYKIVFDEFRKNHEDIMGEEAGAPVGQVHGTTVEQEQSDEKKVKWKGAIGEIRKKMTSNNATMKAWLKEQGIKVAPNSGMGLNCLIISLLQHATGNYDSEHEAKATSWRKRLVQQFDTLSAGQMLHSDDQAFMWLVTEINKEHKISMNVVFIQSDEFGLPYIAPPNRTGNNNVVIWDQGGHFEAIQFVGK